MCFKIKVTIIGIFLAVKVFISYFCSKHYLYPSARSGEPGCTYYHTCLSVPVTIIVMYMSSTYQINYRVDDEYIPCFFHSCFLVMLNNSLYDDDKLNQPSAQHLLASTSAISVHSWADLIGHSAIQEKNLRQENIWCPFNQNRRLVDLALSDTYAYWRDTRLSRMIKERDIWTNMRGRKTSKTKSG